MVHVALGFHRGQGINLLLHLEHVQGGNTQNLGLTALEQGGTVSTRNQVHLNGKVTDIGNAAAIDTEALGEDLLAYDLLHQSVISAANLLRRIGLFQVLELVQELFFDLLHVFIGGDVTFLLARNGQQLL